MGILSAILNQRVASFLVLLVLILSILFFGVMTGMSPANQAIAVAAVTLAFFGFYLFAQQRSAKAASAMEAALKQQGLSQLSGVRPDERLGIEEAKRQFDDSLALLKQSRLGKGALQSMPWFMLIGPPGSGKSTLLRQSGLSFPYMTKNRSAIRGLGGTKNCDWWFADRGILLDTAGRYTTEDEDREEWLAFLRMLRRSRSQQPVNGAIVALSIADVIEGDERQMQEHAEKIRNRIDELTRELNVVFPVYLVFTQCDRLRGFVEMFDTLNKEERKQVWGFTFPYDRPPGFSQDAEFAKHLEQLFEVLATRRIQLLSTENMRRRRAQTYAFPLQFSKARDNLAMFFSLLQQDNPYQEASAIRGVYFTSGTQEGSVIDKILSWAKPGDLQSEVLPENRKCYFVDDLFNKVVFDDAQLAAPTSKSLKSKRITRTVSAVALGMAALVAIWMGLHSRSAYAEAWTEVRACLDADTNAAGDTLPVEAKRLTHVLDLIEQDKAALEAGSVLAALRDKYYTRSLQEHLLGAVRKQTEQQCDQAVRDAQAPPFPSEVSQAGEWFAGVQRKVADARKALESLMKKVDALRSRSDRAEAEILWNASLEASGLSQADTARHFTAYWKFFEMPDLAKAMTMPPSDALERAEARLAGILNKAQAELDGANSNLSKAQLRLAMEAYQAREKRADKEVFAETTGILGNENSRTTLGKLLAPGDVYSQLVKDIPLSGFAISKDRDLCRTNIEALFDALRRDVELEKAHTVGSVKASELKNALRDKGMTTEAESLRDWDAIVVARRNRMCESLQRDVRQAWRRAIETYVAAAQVGNDASMADESPDSLKTRLSGVVQLARDFQKALTSGAKCADTLSGDSEGQSAPAALSELALDKFATAFAALLTAKEMSDLSVGLISLEDESGRLKQQISQWVGPSSPYGPFAECAVKVLDATCVRLGRQLRSLIEKKMGSVLQEWNVETSKFPFEEQADASCEPDMVLKLSKLLDGLAKIQEMGSQGAAGKQLLLAPQSVGQQETLKQLRGLLCGDGETLLVPLAIKTEVNKSYRITLTGINNRTFDNEDSVASQFLDWPMKEKERLKCSVTFASNGEQRSLSMKDLRQAGTNAPAKGIGDDSIKESVFAILRLFISGDRTKQRDLRQFDAEQNRDKTWLGSDLKFGPGGDSWTLWIRIPVNRAALFTDVPGSGGKYKFARLQWDDSAGKK